MDGKVLLYDSNDVKIGETYIRRARQLVKQQRAFWVDESQQAIRFAPGMENLDDALAADMDESKPIQDLDTLVDKELMKLAKRRVQARFGFKLHCSICVIISVFLVMIYLLTDRGGYFWPIWPMLALGLGIVIHWMVYKQVCGGNMNDEIAFEYEKLKYRRSYVENERRKS